MAGEPFSGDGQRGGNVPRAGAWAGRRMVRGMECSRMTGPWVAVTGGWLRILRSPGRTMTSCWPVMRVRRTAGRRA